MIFISSPVTIDDNASANSRLAQTDVNANAQPALEESTILSVAQPHSSKTTKLSPQLDNSTATPFDGSQSLFSVLISSGSNETSLSSHTLKPPTPSIDSSLDGSRLVSSRSAPISSPPGMSTSTNQSSEVLPPNHMVANSSASATFNPPPGSRLLAFGSRVPSGGDVIPSKSHPSLEPAVGQASPPGIPSISSHKFVNMPPSVSTNSPMTGSMHHLPEAFSGMGPESHFGANARLTPSESSRSIRSFSPHGNMTQMGELHDVTSLGQMNDSMRRASVASAVERAAFGLPTENGASYVDLGGAANFSGSFDTAGGNVTGGGNYATGKGSRFAKFFDNKAREGQHVGVRKGQGIPGFTSTSPHPGPRQDVVALNGMAGNNGDARTMEDIFTMLQNSAQVCRFLALAAYARLMRSAYRIIEYLHSSLTLVAFSLVEARSAKTSPSCTRYNNSSFICRSISRKTATLTLCTTAVSTTGILCPMGWYQAFGQLHLALEAESLVVFCSMTN